MLCSTFSGADPAILKRVVPKPGQRGVPTVCPHSNALIGQKRGGSNPWNSPLDPPMIFKLYLEIKIGSRECDKVTTWSRAKKTAQGDQYEWVFKIARKSLTQRQASTGLKAKCLPSQILLRISNTFYFYIYKQCPLSALKY